MPRKIKIFNTLTGKKDLIKPRHAGKINLFVCGPTVYDYSHIGHARNYVAFDAFVKYLKISGYSVYYLQNITDIDDKIIARAREKGVSPKDLALAFEQEYLQTMKALGVNSITKYARATAHIKEIISQTQRLLQKGFAYEISGDGIYYDISKFKDYGKLSGRTALQAEDAVSRIDYSKDKRNRGDFCLWKFTQDSSEPNWPSPWGNGRPGWHIEDTAITEKYFGAQYDIHGAARDLIFPHHEAEIAQMEALSGKKPLTKYWMHVGFLTVKQQKMSKSLENFITIRDILSRISPQCLRFLILKNLWSSPVDYSDSALMETKSALEKIEEFLRKIVAVKTTKLTGKQASHNKKIIEKLKKDFYKELDDDFNTPKAFAVVFEFIKQANQLLDEEKIAKTEAGVIYKFFEEFDKVFGVIDFKRVKFVIPLQIRQLAKLREECRKNKEWQKSDLARMEIEKQGYILEDGPNGPIIRLV
jgi:cysteinyl-tRNA synthetase